MVSCGKQSINGRKKSWRWKRTSMLSKMRRTHKELSERLSFCRSWTVTRTLLGYRMSLEQKMIGISTSYSILWTQTCTQLFEQIFWKTFTSNTSYTSVLSVSSTCTLQTYCIVISSQVIFCLTLSVIWKSLILDSPDHSIPAIQTRRHCSLITLPPDGTGHQRFSSDQTSILRE